MSVLSDLAGRSIYIRGCGLLSGKSRPLMKDRSLMGVLQRILSHEGATPGTEVAKTRAFLIYIDQIKPQNGDGAFTRILQGINGEPEVSYQGLELRCGTTDHELTRTVTLTVFPLVSVTYDGHCQVEIDIFP